VTSYPGTSPDDGIERVVLLDESGRAIGNAPKHSVHNAHTPLHLAFSCYVFDGAGRLLVTQRAFAKATWPGVWTNTVCGHPAPGEGIAAAVRRRVGEELGIGLDDLRVVLPRYRYRAVMTNGTVENEMCPVFVAWTSDEPDADPVEVAATTWVAWADFRSEVVDGTRDVSPWCLDQVGQLAGLGDDPRTWSDTPRSELPLAVPESDGLEATLDM
jgi:isopentenyl-diphosphate delta-isomerase